MNIGFKPANSLHGTIDLPASKSYSIRAFVTAACGGKSRIRRPSDCDDARVACRVATQLGAKISRLNAADWAVDAARTKKGFARINVGESGTVLRLLLPLVTLFTSKAVVAGQGTLKGRPNHHLTSLLRSRGVRIRGEGPREGVPIRYSGGDMRPGEMRIKGSLSSQFISALLISCPLLTGNSRIRVSGGKMVSADYVEMTRRILSKAGIQTIQKSSREWVVPGGQKFKGLKKFTVPSDYGLAAFPLAAGLLVDSEITLNGYFDDGLLQADGRILDLLKKMGAKITRSSKALKVKGPQALKGGNFSLKDCPDLVPIMAVLALFACGKTRLRDIAHVRAKESDRIGDLSRELRKAGACLIEKKNELVIIPQKSYKNFCVLDPHHDHRLAMAFCILGLKVGVIVKDIECVKKSYPGFIADMKKFGASAKSGK